MANVLQANKVDAQGDKLATETKLTTLCIKNCQFSVITPPFNQPHLHLAPPLGVTLFEYC